MGDLCFDHILRTKTHPWVELDFEIMGNMAGPRTEAGRESQKDVPRWEEQCPATGPGGQSRIWTNMFTGIAVEHNQWIIVPFDVTQDYHEYGLPGTFQQTKVLASGLQLLWHGDSMSTSVLA